MEISEAFEGSNLTLNLELDKAISKIKAEGHKTVLVQLPDGLKPKAAVIQEELLAAIPELLITFWAGDCYGACDTPNVNGFDLFLAFGHSVWKY
ncbi:hypothetical protein HOC01_06505 [archaeon]|jgi:2-(3-amino-3-carboxypropyl)histidine synthase|nr:hypothetical protein [archaeon]MBT6697508.1 hypothetical protein [archaeon]